jgi:glutathione synthase/RimK-type ligase-like ATP-grasp enzyme
MFLFCLIIIFEYGKVLRNDNVHLKSIKEKNKLTEINITSPTCAVEIFDQTGENPITKIFDCL